MSKYKVVYGRVSYQPMDEKGNPDGEPVQAKAGKVIEMTEKMAKPVVAQGRLKKIEEKKPEKPPAKKPEKKD